MTDLKALAERIEAMAPIDVVRYGGRYLFVRPTRRILHEDIRAMFIEYGGEVGFKFFPTTHQIEHVSGGKLFGMTDDMIDMRRHRGLRLTCSNSAHPDVRHHVRPTKAEMEALLRAKAEDRET